MQCMNVQVDLGLRCLYRHKTGFYYHVAHFIEQAAQNWLHVQLGQSFFIFCFTDFFPTS